MRVFIALLGLQSIAVHSLSAQQRIVLTGATVLDGRGGAPVSRARIVIEAGHFTCVSDSGGCPSQSGDRTLDLTGKWISPGLIDTHVHLPFAKGVQGLWRQQRLRFALGITTVRDAGSLSTDTLLAARTSSESGSRPVPRLVVASRVVAEDAARLGVPMGAPMVAKLAAMGVNAIKIKEPFVKDDWREQIRAARAAGIPAFGHTWASSNEVYTRQMIAAGISGISHIMAIAPGSQPAGTVLTPPDSAKDFWPWEKRLWLTADSAQLDSLTEEMLAAHVWLEPTLAFEYHFGRAIAPPAEVPFLREPPTLRELLRGGAVAAPPVPPAYPETWARQAAFVGHFIQRGGVVVAGSDGKAPGIDLHEEFRLIGEVAGSPMEGLRSATSNAAIALNRADIGTIEVGKLADAVVYAANPLGERGASMRIERVVKGGVLYAADSLRAEFQHEYDARSRELWLKRLVRAFEILAIVLVAGSAIVLLMRRRRVA